MKKMDGNEAAISLASIGKWAKARAKDLKQLQKALERAGDSFDGVLKERLDKTNWRALGNRIRKLRREFPTAGRFQQKVKAELAREAKRFGKIIETAKSR